MEGGGGEEEPKEMGIRGRGSWFKMVRKRRGLKAIALSQVAVERERERKREREREKERERERKRED